MPWSASAGPGLAAAVMASVQVISRPRSTRTRLRDHYRPLPVLETKASWPTAAARRLPILVNMACNGITAPVRLRGD